MAAFFFLFLNMLFYSINCEQSEILPLGDIISSVADITNAITSNQKEGSINDAVTDSLPKINLKIVPSKKLHITKSDLVFLLSELRQEIRRQMGILEDELEEKERMRQRSSSLWNDNESAIYTPNEKIDESQEVSTIEDEEEKEEIEDLLDSLNKIKNEDNDNTNKNVTYDIEIHENRDTHKQNDLPNDKGFKQKSLRNGPIMK
ncbi:secreted ookinete protein, putative [Plasmodium sp. gorilla clade G3]|nr:secreted ookinete protein, putative [Plasmodium sp. gorilla clade G3]